MFYRGFLPLFALIAATVMACSDSSDRRSAVIPEVPQVPEAPQITSVRTIVETLASDEFEGRDNQSPGSALAREFLFEELSKFAQPINPDAQGIEGYLQPYDLGTNVLAIIPGGELEDEYVNRGSLRPPWQ